MVTTHSLLTEVVKMIKREHEDQCVADSQGKVNIIFTSKNGTIRRVYDMEYGFIDSKVFIEDASHPEKNTQCDDYGEDK